jgi:1A family penicillin-binding protein
MLKKIIVFLTSFFVLSFVFLSILFLYYIRELPRPEFFTERLLSQSTKIYDKTGKILLYEIFDEEKRSFVPLSSVPEKLKQAVLVAEDANFYQHKGIEIRGIIRATIENLKKGKPIYGGSTISQQLIRSTFLSSEKTLNRKIKEIILTLELERKYSKDQILEWYLNQVPFGQNAYGVEAASQTYFRKRVSELNLAEMVTLAALIKAPYKLSPYDEEGKKYLFERRKYILERMLEKNYISEKEYKESLNYELTFAPKKIEIKAPYFTLWVVNELEKKYGRDFLARAGFKVYTTLDWNLQQIAEKVVKEGIERNRKFNAANAALVAISPKTGEVLCLTVGTGNYFDEPFPPGCQEGVNCLFDPKFNVVVGTKGYPGRQPGSAFKPFVFATAFAKGHSDKEIVIDEPTNFGIWGGKEYKPQNYDGKFRGPVTLREALAQSLNVPSVKVLLEFAGLEDSVKTAKDLGISTLKGPFGPSIVLGGWEVLPLEITSAYGVFANDGYKSNPFAIWKIENAKGEIIFEQKISPLKVMEERVARLINDILSDNEARAPAFGANSPLYFKDYQVAAKTGTTQDFRDAWTIGYTPSIVVGVWVGNNNNAPMEKRPGVMLAAPIFHQFLESVLPKIKKERFQKIEL